jgi:hypothetical protein
MGIIQLFLTFLVDGLRAALAAALLIGWPIFPGLCGAVSGQARVTSKVDAIVVPCGPVEIRFRVEENGLTVNGSIDQPRRERDHAIVALLDVIEAAAAVLAAGSWENRPRSS